MKGRTQVTTSAVLLMLLISGITTLAGGEHNDIDDHRSCTFCGMDRKAYGFSRMLIRYEDGAEVGTCSLHCAAIEIDASKGRPIRTILIADRDSRTLIDAEQAYWVMGGAKPGVMTQQPKWAFATRSHADAFIVKFGGTIATWTAVLAAARKEATDEQR
jgi:copper chaperone NosL